MTAQHLARLSDTLSRELAPLGARLSAEVSAVIEAARAVEGAQGLLFEVEGEWIWERFPVRLMLLSGEGKALDSGIEETELLSGTQLLQGVDNYPLGRADFIGVDTTPDLAVVERCVIQALSEAVARLGEEARSLGLVAGRADDPDALGPCIEYHGVDLRSGAAVVLEVWID